MNVNEQIMTLKALTGLPVVPDMYEGSEEKYIVFTYEDERPVHFGGNAALQDTVWLQVALYTPPAYNYMALKKTIRDHLESLGFICTSIQSWLDTTASGAKIRHTTLSVTYTDVH